MTAIAFPILFAGVLMAGGIEYTFGFAPREIKFVVLGFFLFFVMASFAQCL